MNKTRREFTPEFKHDAVALLRSSGRSLMQVVGELGIQPSMLRSWRRRPNGEAPQPQPIAAGTGPVASLSAPVSSPTDQAGQIACMRRELERIRLERVILRKPLLSFRESEMRFRVIAARASTWPVRTACHVLDVSIELLPLAGSSRRRTSPGRLADPGRHPAPSGCLVG
jgi:transposase